MPTYINGIMERKQKRGGGTVSFIDNNELDKEINQYELRDLFSLLSKHSIMIGLFVLMIWYI